MTGHNTLSAIEQALDNERCKLGSLEDLLLTLIDGTDPKRGPNPFYALLAYVEPITERLAEITAQLSVMRHSPPDGAPVADGSVFAERLAEYQARDAAYALADSNNEPAKHAAYESMAAARMALLETEPQTAEHARHLLAVCFAELCQDMTVGGPLPDAILAAMGASIRALAQPNPTPDMARRAWREQGVVILWPEKISDDRQRAALLNIVTKEYGPRAGGPLVVKVDRLAKRRKAAKRGKGARS